jgi:integrase
MNITQRYVESLKPLGRDTIHRDTALKGFGVRVTKGGTISFIVETKVNGRSKRIKIGSHPALSVALARQDAAIKLNLMHSGIDPVKRRKHEIEEARGEEERQKALSTTLGDVFERYMHSRSLKLTTARDYKGTVRVVFGDWLDRPIRKISRREIEDRFTATRDNRGKAQAVKSMRILSSIMNFAMADEVFGERLITDNPCDVLKQKRINRTIPKRDGYLEEDDIRRLFHFFFSVSKHEEAPKTGVKRQGINYIALLLSTGLRKSEALSIRWNDVKSEKMAFIVPDTKNGTDHWVPISNLTRWILDEQREVSNASEWVFPARVGKSHMTEPRSQLKKIITATGVSFSLHDCRRTFATHAKINGLDHDMIRRALNHKSGGSITDSYIQGGIDMARPTFEAVADQYEHYYLGENKGRAKYNARGKLVIASAEEGDHEAPTEPMEFSAAT